MYQGLFAYTHSLLFLFLLRRRRESRCGEGESEDRAAALAILHPYFTAMGFDNGAADREAESNAASRGADAYELFEDALLLSRRYAGTAICQLDGNGVKRFRSRELKRRTRPGCT